MRSFVVHEPDKRSVGPEAVRFDSRALDGLPIGCNVKGESGAFSDDFSACLIAGGQTTPHEVVLVDIDGDVAGPNLKGRVGHATLLLPIG